MEAKINFGGPNIATEPKPVDAYLFCPAFPCRPCSVNSLYNICKFMASGESQSGLEATAAGFSHCVVTTYVLMLNENLILENEVIIY